MPENEPEMKQETKAEPTTPKPRAKKHTKHTKYEPSFELRHFVQALFDPEVMGNFTKADQVTNVSRFKFHYWIKKSQEFRDWYSEQCTNFLARHEAAVGYALLRKSISGDVPAMRTYYEVKNKTLGKLPNYIDKSKHETNIINTSLSDAIRAGRLRVADIAD